MISFLLGFVLLFSLTSAGRIAQRRACAVDDLFAKLVLREVDYKKIWFLVKDVQSIGVQRGFYRRFLFFYVLGFVLLFFALFGGRFTQRRACAVDDLLAKSALRGAGYHKIWLSAPGAQSLGAQRGFE